MQNNDILSNFYNDNWLLEKDLSQIFLKNNNRDINDKKINNILNKYGIFVSETNILKAPRIRPINFSAQPKQTIDLINKPLNDSISLSNQDSSSCQILPKNHLYINPIKSSRNKNDFSLNRFNYSNDNSINQISLSNQNKSKDFSNNSEISSNYILNKKPSYKDIYEILDNEKNIKKLQKELYDLRHNKRKCSISNFDNLKENDNKKIKKITKNNIDNIKNIDNNMPLTNKEILSLTKKQFKEENDKETINNDKHLNNNSSSSVSHHIDEIKMENVNQYYLPSLEKLIKEEVKNKKIKEKDMNLNQINNINLNSGIKYSQNVKNNKIEDNYVKNLLKFVNSNKSLDNDGLMNLLDIKEKQKENILKIKGNEIHANELKGIKFNLNHYPENKKLFKSYDIQVKCLGNEKYRNIFLKGINTFNTENLHYKQLTVPKSNDEYLNKNYDIISNDIKNNSSMNKKEFKFGKEYKKNKFDYAQRHKFNFDIYMLNSEKLNKSPKNIIKIDKFCKDNKDIYNMYFFNDPIEKNKININERMDYSLNSILKTNETIKQRKNEYKKMEDNILKVYDDYIKYNI